MYKRANKRLLYAICIFTKSIVKTISYYGFGEIGEVIDIVKKNGGAKSSSDVRLRNDFVEEMADVLMYYNDVMLCYGIFAEELKKSYTEKFEKNMKRW